MARLRPYYSNAHITNYLEECDRGGQTFWCALWHDHARGSYDGRCYQCMAPVAITEEAMERTFWRRENVPRGTEPKVKCDRCGCKLHVVPNKQLLDEMLNVASIPEVQRLKNEREDAQHKEFLTRPFTQPNTQGENLLVDIWDLLTDNYGDLPAPVQMWLEENDGLEQMVEEIRKRQRRAQDDWATQALAKFSGQIRAGRLTGGGGITGL
jgi:hypothetical protein